MVSLHLTLTLLINFSLLQLGKGFDDCSRSNIEVISGIEPSADPMTTMTASSERDPDHGADKGLALGKTGWSPRTAQRGEWLEADIGSWAYIKQVRIVTRTPGLRVKVEASMDLQDWTLADKMISKGEYIKAEFSRPVMAQFVRVTVTKVTRDVELEMIVIGCKRRRGVAVEHRLFSEYSGGR
ncbi:uncharacterized protein LOC135478045 [Liolophura sinensis]|uniref:uncharacterized protein LOC135478045 n=1 Tax=Liolophura sinensis TaxID=3198878 RepID=UPI0031592E65